MIPTNLIRDSLLSRVEKQYNLYIKQMTLQMAAESNDIFRHLFDHMEKQTSLAWKAHLRISESADTIIQSNID
jgi:hypothetical protein